MEDSSLKPKLEKILSEIKLSWTYDMDKIEYYIYFNEILKDILSKESIEEYFSNNQDDIIYFLQTFLNESLYYILRAFTIYGENGDQIGLEILLNIFNIFIKFHKNKRYISLFGNIRNIFENDLKRHNFFEGSNKDSKDSIKKYDYFKFNLDYNSEFLKSESQKKKFEVGDIVDIPFEYDQCHQYRIIDKFCWIRTRVKEVTEEEYVMECWNNKEQKISLNDLNIYPCGTKTVDWDWRANLKVWDLIDCFERNRWYPATVLGILQEEDIYGIKYLTYHIGFRVYPDHFNNLEDPEDDIKKHLDIWKKPYLELDFDSKGEKFYGDGEGFDERIPMFSKRIQKFNTFSKIQQKYLNYFFRSSGYKYPFDNENSKNEQSNLLKIMNENLYYDTILMVDKLYKYTKDGKKNIIIGKTGNFSYFFALYLKKIENEDGFEKLIEIIQNNPDSEEIYTVFFILYHCFNYIHIDFFKEKESILRKACNEFINNFEDKNNEMKKMHNDFINIIINLFEKIYIAKFDNSLNKENTEDKNEDEEFINLNILTLSLMDIKANSFDKRLKAIKSIEEIIKNNKDNKSMKEKILELFKKHNIIKEIFGPNYHCEIIKNSKEVIKFLISENQLNHEDI